MPRPLVLGNGEMLVNLDAHFSVRDLYYPYVGWANHVGGHRCRVGVWAEGSGFAWIDDTWERTVAYQADTLVTDCAATHHGLGIRLKIAHAVLHDRNIFVARYRLENLWDTSREVRLFLAQDLRVDESDIGDTVFYSPYAKALVHYKRDRYFLFGGQAGGSFVSVPPGPKGYACGEKGFKGAEGAWRDAEDGTLSMNAIAQGSVDSVGAYSVIVPAQGKQTVRTWTIAGETLEEVATRQDTLLADGFDHLLEATALHWFGVSHKARPDLDVLPDKVAKLYARSLLIIRTQADKRGAILASNDTDILETARAHYSYLWPRDGALVSLALDSAGQRQISRAFFEFCARVLPADRAALMHKYGPDGTVGASWHPWIVDGVPEVPFQEDGTALVVYALWSHVKTGQDPAFAARMWQFVRRSADFLAEYRSPQTHLPLPSWDLWEERRGCHVWTVASVIAALRAASEYAQTEGHAEHAARYGSAADQTLAAFQTHFWDDTLGRHARMVSVMGDGSLVRDMTVDSSASALFLFGVLPPNDPRLAATMHAIGRTLWVKSPVGGLARYEQDYYFRVSDDFTQVPGNPWVICTLWLADWYCATATSRAELKSASDLLEWTVACAMETGVLAEQVHPFTRESLSVAPLTWSHAQLIASASAYLDKWKLLG